MASTAIVLSLLWVASLAFGAITVGQLSPDIGGAMCNSSQIEYIVPTVSSGASYALPGKGVITSWTTNAGANPGARLTMRVYRPVSPNRYLALAHDGPRLLTPGGTAGNTFATTIQVERGDIIGVNTADGGTTPNRCLFVVDGQPYQATGSPVPDGQQVSFNPVTYGYRVNLSARFEPSNAFSFGTLSRNKKKGTATLSLDLPNAGELTASAGGAAVNPGGAGATPVGAGAQRLSIKARGKKRRRLARHGTAKVPVSVTYTPTGGAARVQSATIKLRKK